MGKNNVDEFGVDHSNFSIRDELEYNFKRAEERNLSPTLRDDKRNGFNNMVESIVKNISSYNSPSSTLNAIKDFGENYINMVNANLKSSDEMKNSGRTVDNYYHCIGNYNATSRGKGDLAAIISNSREIGDYLKNKIKYKLNLTKENPIIDFINDSKVNQQGQRMARGGLYNSGFEACERYRPLNYNPNEQWKYYK